MSFSWSWPDWSPELNYLIRWTVAGPISGRARSSAPLWRAGWSVADHDLAGDFAAGVVAPTGFGVVEGIHAVDDRPDLMLFHHPAQVLQVATAARRDRLEPRLAHKHGPEVHAALGGHQSAHHGDLATIGDGFDRLRQRTGSADLHDPIHAATNGERAHLAAPIR